MAKASTRPAGEVEVDPSSEPLLELFGVAKAMPDPEVRSDLLDTIQRQVIPKLVMAHRREAPDGPADCPDARIPPTAEEVGEFAALALAQDVPAALLYVQELSRQGLSLETILLHLLASAARLLGDRWLLDEATFAEVTIGLGTIQKVVHVLGPRFAAPIEDRGFVVLLSAPMEQHTLGIFLLGEFLRRAGWAVQVEPNMPEADLVTVVRSQDVQMVGITVSSADHIKPLAHMISAVKQASLNADVVVMLGGSLEVAEHAFDLGATFCSDPREAVRWLDEKGKKRPSVLRH